jgi:hypothetical protein
VTTSTYVNLKDEILYLFWQHVGKSLFYRYVFWVAAIKKEKAVKQWRGN